MNPLRSLRPQLDTQFFDPSTEAFSAGPELAFSVVAHEFSEVAPLANGAFVIAEGGINTRRRQSQVFDPIARTFSTVGYLNVFHLPPAQATALNERERAFDRKARAI